MLDYIELAANQAIDNLLPSLLIGHTYYIKDSTTNEYKEYVLVPKKKEYVGLAYDKNKVVAILTNKLNKLDKKEFLGVDLELPSGTIWAECNVGAEKPSDAGLYFQWGDTVGYTADQVGTGNGQKYFSWADYKWNPSGDGKTFTKYTKIGDKLKLEDDAAHVNMGGSWHMPTLTQINELLDNTISEWTTQDGVNGRLFTSKKDSSKSIFIPAAGDAWDGSLYDSGDYGYIWSSMLSTVNVDGGLSLGFNSGDEDFGLIECNRSDGLHVRGVIETSTNTNGYSYVDLGLPSGTLWATMNVGASKPSDAGLYFQWGDTSGYTADQIGTGDGQKKFAFDWNDYKWYLSGSEEGENLKFKKYTTTGSTLELEDDAAHVNMGGDWHIPTPAQIQELIDNTTSEWITQDGVNGRLFTSKKDSSKSIFIPATGVAWDGSIHYSGDYGNFWSSMLSAYDVSYGQYLSFYSDSADLSDGDNRRYGFSVRGVIG